MLCSIRFRDEFQSLRQVFEVCEKSLDSRRLSSQSTSTQPSQTRLALFLRRVDRDTRSSTMPPRRPFSPQPKSGSWKLSEKLQFSIMPARAVADLQARLPSPRIEVPDRDVRDMIGRDADTLEVLRRSSRRPDDPGSAAVDRDVRGLDHERPVDLLRVQVTLLVISSGGISGMACAG